MDNPIKTLNFRPTPWAAGPHAQSVLASAPPRSVQVRHQARSYLAAGTEVIIDCGEGVRLLGHHNAASGPSNGRMVVLIHGWEGSAESVYNLSLGPRLTAAGFDTLRLNLRDHGNSHHLNQALFHSCRLSEVVGACRWLNTRYPDRALSVVGFSLGGNFALRVGNQAAQAGLQIDRIIAVCPVLDPAETMEALDAGWPLYERYFIRKWRRSLYKKRAAFPHLYGFDNLAAFTNLKQMTDYFVTRYTDYADLYTYLNGYAITHGRLADLAVRSSMLLADDDPVIPVAGLRNMQIPDTLQVYRTAAGGHCGFLEGLRMRSWLNGFVLDQLYN